MNERGRKLGGGEVCIAQCNDCSFVCCPLRDRPAGGFFQMGGIRPSLSARSRGLLTSSVPCIRVIRSLAVGRFVFHYKSQLGDLHSPLRQRPGGPATRPPATALYSPPPAGQAAHGAFPPTNGLIDIYPMSAARRGPTPSRALPAFCAPRVGAVPYYPD